MRAAAALACAAALALATDAHAFTIETAFTGGCHERITLRAFERAEAVLPIEDIRVPATETWEQTANFLLEAVAQVPSEDPNEKFFYFSLLVGARAPDTEGLSSTNGNSLRAIHENPKGQYGHCLRAADDDGEEGNAHTHDACVRSIRANIERARDALGAESGGRIIQVPITFDHYGTFLVPVWEPAYRIGRALHALQDSFTHSIRSADLHTTYHFVNFVEAVEGDLEEQRDGLAHSDYADQCGVESDQVAEAATEASADLLRASALFLDGSSTDAAGDGDDVDEVLAEWLSFQAGCTLDNDFCDSPWVERARREPTAPFFGCGVRQPLGGGAGGHGGLAALAAIFALALLRRSRRGPLRHPE